VVAIRSQGMKNVPIRSVADPDHFDADPDPDPTSEKKPDPDPDPTSEKKPDPDPTMLYIKFCNKIFLL
jgi:hypothetical protein